MEANSQYFDCLCRTCMNNVEAFSYDGNTNPQQQWLSILDTIEECGEVRIAELLSDAVPQIVVQPSDELPKKICTECQQRLLSVYRFQQMCVRSDKEMHELLSKEQTAMKTPVLEEAIKGETETNDAVSQALKDLPCSSTLQNSQQPSMQEPLAKVTVQTIEQDAAQSSATDQLQDNSQLLEHCNDSQGEFEEFIKNEPIEDDEANSEYSDGDTMHSTISVTKDEPIEHEDEQANDASSRHNCHLCNKSYKRREYLLRHLNDHKKEANDNKEYCFACHLCSKSYKKQPSLTRHLNLAHSKEPQFTCDFCNKSFASSSGLGRHILTHTGERPYVSPQSVPGEQHTTYAEDKPYECPYCPLRFRLRSSVASHKSVHEGAAKRHKCSICGKTFRRKCYLSKHERIHSNEKPHKCDLCEKSFIFIQELKSHKRSHTGEKPYKCKYCEKGFASAGILNSHLRSHLGNNIHRCKFCPLVFPSSAEMRLHLTSHKDEVPEVRERNLKALQEEEAKLKLTFSKERAEWQLKEKQQQHILPVRRTTHTDKPYECPYCPLRFSFSANAARHKKVHEGVAKKHECDICGKKFHEKRNLMRHKRTHGKEKYHKCDLCEKQFAEMEQLKAHIRIHTGEKPFKCKYCEHEFTSRGSLTHHLHCHLGRNIHRCKFCPLAFRLAAEMRSHLTSHKNEDPEIRERNLKALQEVEVKLKLKFSKENTKGQSREEKQQQKLYAEEIVQQSTGIIADQHTTHAEDKSYECPHCPLRFNSKSNLGTHKKIHEEIKRHECDICGRKFRLKNNLKMHKVRVHIKEKPHKCNQCELRFATIEYLQIHIRKHTGEKPFKCKYCERGFASRKILGQHLRKHLGNIAHKCKFCPLAFPSSTEMRLHLISHKNEDPEVRERNLKALQEQEAKLELKFLKELSKEKSREEQQQQKSENEIKQSSTEREEFEEFIKNEPIEDEKPNKDYSDGNTMHTTISLTKDVALPIEFEDQQINETLDEFEEFIKD